MNFDKIKQFITFSRKVTGEDGQSITMSVNIPQMTDEQLVDEVILVCRVMKSCTSVIGGEKTIENPALMAASGMGQAVSPEVAERQFEKGFGMLVKLNNEIVIRGLSGKVEKIVRETLGRDCAIKPKVDGNQLMLA